MRNLTIKREKSAVAALVKLKIYIEDKYIPELYINGVPCRKIGTVKNGATETFKIPEKATRVFAIWDKPTRNVSNDCYELSEGQADVVLSGKATLDTFRFNPFKFDGNNNEEAKLLRKKAQKKTIITFIAIIAGVLIIAGLANAGVFDSLVDRDRPIYTDAPEWDDNASDKVFAIDDMQITLDENFSASSGNGFLAIFESSRVTTFVVREMFSKYPDFEELAHEEYAQKVIEVNKIENTEIKNEDGLCYFVFKGISSKSGEEYTYYGYIFKTEQAFWFVHFAVLTEQASEYESDIVQWAKSIKFNKINN